MFPSLLAQEAASQPPTKTHNDATMQVLNMHKTYPSNKTFMVVG